MTDHFMARALDLAREKVGRTSPNPSVGAVVVRDGQIIGEGSHNGPGTPHAEVAALAAAGELADGAELYVSLEPCSTAGRTGPCTSALIGAGVRRVLFAMSDPDPRNEGRAAEILREAGIEVESGLAESEAMEILEPYIHQRRAGRPFVTAKFATSLDGKIATATGNSRWISSPESRELAHELRARIDAILVGSRTILLDNPRLTARPGGELSDHQPLRVVLDSRGRVSPDAAIFSPHGRALVMTSEHSAEDWRRALSEVAEVLLVPVSQAGEGVDPGAVLAALNERGALHVLLEGGGRVHGSFFDAGLVDKVHVVIAPLIIGGTGHTPVGGAGVERLAEAWRLQRMTVSRAGPDIIVEGLPTRSE